MNPQVAEIYAKLPPLRCKRLCQECCGPVLMSKAEAAAITAATGTLPGVDASLTCTLLDAASGRCAIYEHRPMICRLWGMVKKMKCPHGCVPEGGFVSERKAHKLLDRLSRLPETNPIPS